MGTRQRSRVVVVTILAIVLALVVTACGGDSLASPAVRASADAPSPSPAASSGTTATLVPSPVPTVRSAPEAPKQPPVDVAAAFLASLSRGLSAEADLDGSVRVGPLTMRVSGTTLLSGPDSHQIITIAGAGRPTVTEIATVAGHAFAKRGELWYEQPETGKGDPAALFTALSSLTDTGVVTKGGRSLHRLTPAPGTNIPSSAIGVIPAGATSAELAFEFYAEADGTPAIISVDASWTQKVGTADQPVSMHLDMILSRVGQTIWIEAPSPVWVAMSSKRLAYRMSRPSDWDVEFARKATGYDYLFGPEGQTLGAVRSKSCHCTLNAFTSELIRYSRSHVKGFKLVSSSSTRIGGLRARRIESRGTYPNGRSWDLTYTVMRGGSIYVFDYSSLSPLTSQDRSIAAAMMGTVVFR